jgi:hypothetical protein
VIDPLSYSSCVEAWLFMIVFRRHRQLSDADR